MQKIKFLFKNKNKFIYLNKYKIKFTQIVENFLEEKEESFKILPKRIVLKKIFKKQEQKISTEANNFKKV